MAREQRSRAEWKKVYRLMRIPNSFLGFAFSFAQEPKTTHRTSSSYKVAVWDPG